MNVQFSIRQQVEAEIERLLVVLDTLDGDADAEPSLAGYGGGTDDREGDCEDEGFLDSGIGDMDGLMEQYPHLF